MNLTGEILTPIADIFDSTWKGLDNLFTSDEQRIKAQAILERAKNELDSMIQEQATKVHAADMASDSILSKNIRPAMFLVVTFLLSVQVFYYVITGKSDQNLLYVIGGLDMIMATFYFGGRTGEKMAVIKSLANIGKK